MWFASGMDHSLLVSPVTAPGVPRGRHERRKRAPPWVPRPVSKSMPCHDSRGDVNYAPTASIVLLCKVDLANAFAITEFFHKRTNVLAQVLCAINRDTVDIGDRVR